MGTYYKHFPKNNGEGKKKLYLDLQKKPQEE